METEKTDYKYTQNIQVRKFKHFRDASSPRLSADDLLSLRREIISGIAASIDFRNSAKSISTMFKAENFKGSYLILRDSTWHFVLPYEIVTWC